MKEILPTTQFYAESEMDVTDHCRFCGSSAIKSGSKTCSENECMSFPELVCSESLKCGHPCIGILCGKKCPPCPKDCRRGYLRDRPLKECSICMSDIFSIQNIQLSCGHIFHLQCVRGMLKSGWHGPRINFTFILCPLCKTEIHHPILDDILSPIRELKRDVEQKALTRLQYDGLYRKHQNPMEFAMEKYAYYQCHKCKKAYYGGEEHCQERVLDDNYNPENLVCPQCSDQGRIQNCPKHGTDYITFKCRYCCSFAVYYCFGTTHFCRTCHDNPNLLTSMDKHKLPRCPAGPQGKQLPGEICPLQIDHPPTGEEFPLGCGLCQNLNSF